MSEHCKEDNTIYDSKILAFYVQNDWNTRVKNKFIHIALVAIFFILIEFFHQLYNVTRNLQSDYQISNTEKNVSIVFSVVMLVKTLRNIFIEIEEMSYGLKYYVQDYWNYIELTAIFTSFAYVVLDLLLVLDTL